MSSHVGVLIYHAHGNSLLLGIPRCSDSLVVGSVVGVSIELNELISEVCIGSFYGLAANELVSGS